MIIYFMITFTSNRTNFISLMLLKLNMQQLSFCRRYNGSSKDEGGGGGDDIICGQFNPTRPSWSGVWGIGEK